ncbi:hypothetical protein MASR1M60_30360 [Rhodocyclaceae bacterium]
MKRWFVLAAFACNALAAPVPEADAPPTSRTRLLELVEPMFISLESKRALRPALERASHQQIDDFDRGLYYADIGEADTARRHFEAAAAALAVENPGENAWCIGYRLLRIPDDKADPRDPAVKEMLELRKTLNIPVTAGDLEKTATTSYLQDLWSALPDTAKAKSGPLPATLSPQERTVALAGRGFMQDDNVQYPIQASNRCYLRGPNLKPIYPAGAQLGLADVQFALSNDLAKTKSFPAFWHDAAKLYRHVADTAQPPLSVIAATGAARISERLMAEDATHPPPLDWPAILAAYRAGMEAGHEASMALYANAVHLGLGGLKPDEAEAIRLYKSLLDKKDGLYGGLMTIAFMVYAQEQLTALWRAGKLQLDEEEQRRYLTIGARAKP